MKILRADKTEKIVSYVSSWSRQNEKLVVGIDGFSGVGKTRIAKIIGLELSALNISVDDLVYDFLTRRACLALNPLPAKNLSGCWFRFDEMANFIRAYRSGHHAASLSFYDFDQNVLRPAQEICLDFSILIVEGIFTVGELRKRDLCDKSIFILSDEDEADRRRSSREQVRWGSRFQPDDHPESFVNLFKTAFGEYLWDENLIGRADLIIIN